MREPDPVLTLKSVARAYGAQRVLHGIDLKIQRGESFALVGANGAGKSTLIKGILDLSRFCSGRASLFGVDSRRPEARARLAYLPERFTPPHYLTGRQFLQYVVRLHRTPFDEEAAQRMLSDLALAPEALDRPVRGYSKGMAQKLGLAACLLSAKELLLLDEPMSGLDPQGRARVKALLGAHREAGNTLFFTSHALADVEEIADRLAILHQGDLRFVGSPAECRARFGGATLEAAYLNAVGG